MRSKWFIQVIAAFTLISSLALGLYAADEKSRADKQNQKTMIGLTQGTNEIRNLRLTNTGEVLMSATGTITLATDTYRIKGKGTGDIVSTRTAAGRTSLHTILDDGNILEIAGCVDGGCATVYDARRHHFAAATATVNTGATTTLSCPAAITICDTFTIVNESTAGSLRLAINEAASSVYGVYIGSGANYTMENAEVASIRLYAIATSTVSVMWSGDR